MRRKNLDCEKSQQTVGNMFQPFQLCRAAGNKLLTQMDTDMPWNCENVGAYNLIHWYCRAQDETAIQSRWVFSPWSLSEVCIRDFIQKIFPTSLTQEYLRYLYLLTPLLFRVMKTQKVHFQKVKRFPFIGIRRKVLFLYPNFLSFEFFFLPEVALNRGVGIDIKRNEASHRTRTYSETKSFVEILKLHANVRLLHRGFSPRFIHQINIWTL